jgi:putative nucleotidyltransferase with HDIG domain
LKDILPTRHYSQPEAWIMTASDVKSYIHGLENLPTIPAVMGKIRALSNNGNATVNDLVQLIGHDPALAQQIIRAANSRALGHPGQIRDIRQAILFLGLERIKTMALGLEVMETLPAHPSFDLNNLWIHCCDVALIGAVLSEYVSITSADECFLAALLHDMGRVIFYKMDDRQFNRIVTTEDMLEQEQDIFGCNHGEAGAWFAEKSGLPSEIVAAARYHHHPSLAEEFKDLVSIVSMAEALSRTFDPRIEDDGIWMDEHDAILLELGIDNLELSTVSAKLALARKGVDDFFRDQGIEPAPLRRGPAEGLTGR